MSDEKDYEPTERKEPLKDATPKEKLKYIKELAYFSKSMFGNMSHNDVQEMLDKIIEVSNG